MPGVSAFGSTLKLVKRITSIGVIDTITEVLKARIADGDGSFYTTANPLPTMKPSAERDAFGNDRVSVLTSLGDYAMLEDELPEEIFTHDVGAATSGAYNFAAKSYDLSIGDGGTTAVNGRKLRRTRHRGDKHRRYRDGLRRPVQHVAAEVASQAPRVDQRTPIG
jgi:hypothetical protein